MADQPPTQWALRRLRVAVVVFCSNCYYHVRGLRTIRPYLGLQTFKTIGSSIVASRLDCVSSLQNALPRVDVAGKANIIAELHWLPKQQRTSVKLSRLVFRSLHNTALVTSHHCHVRQIRSPSHNLLVQPCLCCTIGS